MPTSLRGASLPFIQLFIKAQALNSLFDREDIDTGCVLSLSLFARTSIFLIATHCL
jgi:hypothetical protein